MLELSYGQWPQQQLLNNFCESPYGCVEKRGPKVCSFGIDWSSRLDQHLCHLRVLAVDGPMQSRVVFFRLVVDVGMLLQQELHNVGEPVEGGKVQRVPTGADLVVDVRALLDVVLDCIQVAVP